MKFTDKINANDSKRTFTDEGYLLVKDARIARTGIQEYLSAELRNADGSPMFPDREPTDIIKVNRPASEVFDEQSMKSFEMQPVTNNHPAEGVTVHNHDNLAVGVAFNIRKDGIFVLADLKITHTDTIKEVNEGKRELSNGYDAIITVKSGTSDDGKMFDAEQTKIRGNHVAIVEQARCGPVCSMSDNKPEGKVMKLNLSGVPFEVKDESLAAAVQNVITQNTELASKVSTTQATHDAAIDSLKSSHEAETQKLQAQLDQAMANQMTPEKLDAVIEDRLAIINAAQKIIADYDATGKTCMAVKREVLTTKFGDAISADKLENDTYVDARFDALVETAPAATQTPTEKLLADAAVNGGRAMVSDSDVSRTRKLISDSIAYRFPVGARRVGHKDHSAFQEAVDKEMAKFAK